MYLTVDIGNSSAKLALFDGSELKSLVRADSRIPETIADSWSKDRPDRIIISDVSSAKEVNRANLQNLGIEAHYLSHSSIFPFKISYKTPETLGTDRLAAVAGAYNMFPGKHVLIIDAGTAVTYDFIDATGLYNGGNISPGIGMRFRSLNSFTGKLPLVEASKDFKLLGDDTETALRAGVELGVIFEINEYIRTFQNNYGELVTILTGGDSVLLSEHIKFSFTFAPDLTVEGLNYLAAKNA